LQRMKGYWRTKLDEMKERKNARPGLFGEVALRRIAEESERWMREVLTPWLTDSPERKDDFNCQSGWKIVRLYTPNDVAYQDYLRDLGFPGQLPLTRGVYPTLYRGRAWSIRQFSGYGSAEDTNRRLKYLLQEGETGLSVAFHMPTIYGYDSDNPRAYGEVGKCGVAIDSLKDMEIMLDGIPLDRVSTSMTINAPAAILTCMYIAVGEKQGVPEKDLRGTIQNDLFKEYAAQKSWIYTPEDSLRIIRDIMVYCTRSMPLWNYISISGYHIREAGASPLQELAFTLADGFGYVDLGLEAGLDIDEFAPRLSFFFDSGMDFFEEIAKFRAARRLWARTLKEKYGAKDPRSLLLRFHTQTSGVSLTWQQPLNNIVRTTIEALAAVIGGTQSLHTNAYDEAWALPSKEAATVALRTQQVIAEETGVANTIDPLGGSYYIEWLTDKMEEEACRYLDRIEERGGILEALKSGYIQREIAENSYRTQLDLERDRRVVVGLNSYRVQEQPPIETLKVDPEVQRRQIERVKRIKSERDNKAVREALDELEKSMKDPKANMVPSILKAVREYATIQEIIDVGREVFGEWREPSLY